VSFLQLGLAFVSAVEPNSRKDTAFLPPFKARLFQVLRIMEWLISWRSDLLAAYAASSPLITSTARYTDLSRLDFAGILNPENPALISLGLELMA
jgi:hypothetical protein